MDPLFTSLSELFDQELTQQPADDTQSANQQLQSLIQVAGTMLRAIGGDHAKLDRAVAGIVEAMLKVATHGSANVRKTIVFFMVDIYFMLNESDFSKYLARFGENQQKLVQIYRDRRCKEGTGSATKK